ncbi:copper homeostasis protein CutC [Thaumasiovibrio subtropicus]|uniref:copper homeostasis protein CutC n=1 Tax=Thaumasiovibrio subtropicus TaxID=1891207 RepID=UPI000B360DB0|nr:copper homeostasis protein CutC [Thaumasiovibrio subtropicus]
MTMEIEVCIDNIESLHTAQKAGATRIELCSSLAVGGLTPSIGLMRQAALHAHVPVYAMIRPRQGDFLFNDGDLAVMLDDIRAVKESGLHGIVIGCLTPNGEVDMPMCQQLVDAANGLGITFHRAIDQCVDYHAALDNIIALGCERVLTSGLEASAHQGINTLKEMVNYCGDRLSIMAGAGVSAQNVSSIIRNSGVQEIHLSGKTTRPSYMTNFSSAASMGSVDDFAIPVTDYDKIAAVSVMLKGRPQ